VNSNVITFKIEPRARSRRSASRVLEPAPSPDADVVATTSPTSRLARMLALAHHIEQLIDEGKLRDYAHPARLLGVSRARLTQIMNLLYLPVPLQEDVLLGRLKTTERGLRAALKDPVWPTNPSG